jgi:outer membrane protein OmpA-like peptidoglycan-associated protein
MRAKFWLMLLPASITMLTACSSTTPPPRELLDARYAYQRASEGPASTRATPELSAARKALDAAEKSYANDDSDPATKDLAYVADRKARTAGAKGEAVLAQQEQVQTQTELALWKSRMESSREKAREARIESERQARIAADTRTRSALEGLPGVDVSNQDRNLVITLGGNIFATGKDTLSQTGRMRVSDIAGVLADQKREVVLRGHTDASGNDDKNLDLSRRRAEAVERFMVGRGVPASLVKVEGLGSSQPIADNGTANGRAKNRRIEFIVGPPPSL